MCAACLGGLGSRSLRFPGFARLPVGHADHRRNAVIDLRVQLGLLGFTNMNGGAQLGQQFEEPRRERLLEIVPFPKGLSELGSDGPVITAESEVAGAWTSAVPLVLHGDTRYAGMNEGERGPPYIVPGTGLQVHTQGFLGSTAGAASPPARMLAAAEVGATQGRSGAKMAPNIDAAGAKPCAHQRERAMRRRKLKWLSTVSCAVERNRAFRVYNGAEKRLSASKRRRKEILLKHHSNPQNRRVLRNVLMTTALAAIIASVASIQPTSAHAHHGQTHGKQADHSTRGYAASGHNRHGVRDKLFARHNLFSKQTDHSAETGRSFNDSGIASVYSGQHTASGETMNSGDMTAAHRTLPFGTKVTVVNHNNGRSAVVRINDRGPFVRGRVIDLSPAAGRALGVDGLALVSLSR